MQKDFVEMHTTAAIPVPDGCDPYVVIDTEQSCLGFVGGMLFQIHEAGFEEVRSKRYFQRPEAESLQYLYWRSMRMASLTTWRSPSIHHSFRVLLPKRT
jgi:hypothetical protein